MYNVEYFSKKLKQANQATISHGSSIWIHHLNVLPREEMLLLFLSWRWNFLLFVFQVEYFSRNSNRPTKQQFPMVLRLVYILSTYCTERICFYFTSFDRRCLLFVGCFFRFRGHVQLPKLSIRNKFVMKMLSCTIIVVIMSNHIRRITLNLLCTVTCCAVQQIFFFSLQNFQFERSLLLKWYFAQSL